MTLPQESAAHSCPNCRRVSGITVGYELADVPTNSCILLDSQEDAIAYPRGDISLAACESCGFVWNLCFDEELAAYTSRYEVSQAHSPTFGAFARSLARRWIERYQLHGAKVVEIGCGQAEFLELMIDLGVGAGVGFDPICQAQDRQELSIVRDHFSAKYRDYGGEFLFCRHTLEHLKRPDMLVQEIADYLGRDVLVPVCFEVPDFDKVMAESAFWDIYYEHCSYFDPESLRHLFESHAFEVLDIQTVFDDQYLVIETRANKAAAHVERAARNQEHHTARLERILGFAEQITEKRRKWYEAVDRWTERGKRICLWGSGSKAVGFLTNLQIESQICCVVDINPAKHGKYMPGCHPQIVSPDNLSDFDPDLVIVMNPNYLSEIGSMLVRLGFTSELCTVQSHPESLDV